MKIFVLLSIISFNALQFHVNFSTNLAEFFYSVCLNTQAYIDRVDSLARVANWRPLPKQILDGFVPERRPQRYFGWFVSDLRAFVMALQGVDENGRRYHGCSVFFRDASPHELMRELFRRYVTNPLRHNDGFQHYVHFQINVSETRHNIMISFPGEERQRGTLAINTLVYP